MEIMAISHRDVLLKQVIALGDKNKQTLGMLPEGAFHQHARNKTIIVAVENNNLAGYLLFRISQKKRLVNITHLCISDEYQSKGVAIALLQELKLKYQNLLSGMMLTCRADYERPSQLWEKFGFKARIRKRSKAKTGEYYLIKWLYDFGNTDLFSDLSLENPKIRVVLDSSILIPLSDNEASLANSEVAALNADWLEDEVEYAATQEIFNELNRDKDLPRAQKTRDFLKKYEVVHFKPDGRDRLVKDLKAYLPGETPNDISDRTQLAECIASGATYFVTLDKEILDISEPLYEKYGLDVLRPVQFVLLIDEASNSLDYRSFRLAGANYDSTKLRGEDIEDLVTDFCGVVVNERKQDLREIITSCVKDLKKGNVRVIRDKNSEAIGVYGIQFDHTGVSLDLVRIKRSSIAVVLFQQLVRDIILFSLHHDTKVVIINEANISEEQESILSTMGFTITNNKWQKLSLYGIRTLEQVLTDPNVEKQFDTTQLLQAINTSEAKDTIIVNLERKIWPLKISTVNIPVYIIPIRPFWASQLFDFYTADASLFGASESLAWSRENIYYRSVNPVTEKAPGRILWYVSSDEKVMGRSRGIVATSYLDEVYVDRAQEIFRRCKRFGVYQWKDIYKLANRSNLSKIKALKFSDTEVFKKIIHLKAIDHIM